KMAPLVARCCLAGLRSIPVVFIVAVIVWSYYAYVLQMCAWTVENTGEKVIYLVLYHPLLFMFAWAYWKTIFTPVGTVPKEFYLPPADLERFEHADNEDIQRDILVKVVRERNLPVQCRTNSGAIRYCEKCKCVKPDRCHHCSVCGACVLKMDHHCPWVNNCVCYTTYKFFVLFLGYALLYCLYIAATSAQYFVKFWTKPENSTTKIMVQFLFFVAGMFGLALIILLGFHIFLVHKNRSTIESFRAPIFRGGPEKDGFNLGRNNNFIEVFGEEKKKWFLPIFTSCGDGVMYPTRLAPGNSYSSMDTSTPTGATSPFQNNKSVNDSETLLGRQQKYLEEGVTEPPINNAVFDNQGVTFQDEFTKM
ncbi:unnamed protein product, partial [Owenia fusiformis]